MIHITKRREIPSSDLMQGYTVAVFNFASIVSADYKGGNWRYVDLSNGGFYLELQSDERFLCRNHTTGAAHEVDAELFSLIVNEYACSHLSFELVSRNQTEHAEKISENYYLLRGYLYQDGTEFDTTAAFDILD